MRVLVTKKYTSAIHKRFGPNTGNICRMMDTDGWYWVDQTGKYIMVWKHQ